MRSFFIILAFVAICGCRVSYPYMDLRHPIYMVTDKSFWTGCKVEPAGEEACRKFRIAQVNDGVDDWLRHFDEPTRPRVIIVDSQVNLPRDVFNAVIHLKINHKDSCLDGDGKDDGENKPKACYKIKRGSRIPEIVFDNPDHIFPSLVAHEFGHALGLEHEDPLSGIHSIMLPFVSYEDYVLPVDIDTVCKLHAECPLHESTWCEGGFYDKDLCPSDSYEEGWSKYEAKVEDEE